MALKPCHECGKEISNTADKCPHCGAPPKVVAFGKAMQSCGCLLTVFVTVPIILIVMGACPV